MAASEYKFWTNPATTAGAAKRIQAVFPGWSNIKQFEGDIEVVPGVRAIATPGHTPGHTSYHIGSGGQQLIVLGDVTNIRALNVTNPGWHLVFDADPAMAGSGRRKMFDRAIADKVTLTGYHWGMPGAGTLAKDGNGYAFTRRQSLTHVLRDHDRISPQNTSTKGAAHSRGAFSLPARGHGQGARGRPGQDATCTRVRCRHGHALCAPCRCVGAGACRAPCRVARDGRRRAR